MSSLKVRIGEVTYDDRMDEYEIVAENNIQGRGLLVEYLGSNSNWKSIRIREAPGKVEGLPRVVRKIS